MGMYSEKLRWRGRRARHRLQVRDLLTLADFTTLEYKSFRKQNEKPETKPKLNLISLDSIKFFFRQQNIYGSPKIFTNTVSMPWSC